MLIGMSEQDSSGPQDAGTPGRDNRRATIGRLGEDIAADWRDQRRMDCAGT